MATWCDVYYRLVDLMFLVWFIGLPWMIVPKLSNIGTLIWYFSWLASIYVYMGWIVLRKLIPFPTPARWLAIRLPQDPLSSFHYSSQLCKGCCAVLSQSRLLNGTWRIVVPSIEWHEFQGIGLDGSPPSELTCRLCAVFFSSLGDVRLNPPSSGTPLLSGPILQYGSSPVTGALRTLKPRIKVFQTGRRDGVTYLQLQFPDIAISDAFEVNEKRWSVHDRHPLLVPQLRSLNTWSPDSIQAAKAWILNCDTKHPECKQNGNFRPTRLLEITSDTRSAKVIDLGKSHHLSPEGYTVLSHCWGPRGIEQRLTTTNQNEYYRHIACIDLPRNFQDAITVTIDLGFRYIWIDSLCILQDSVDDWRAESVTMGDVFRHAAVTISATASSDSKGGCFRERDSFLHTNCTLMASTTSNLFLDVSPRVRGQCSSLEDLFVEKVDCAPLSLRSWTYQERVLSRRIIHFCDGIILFECNTVRGSEFHDPAGEVYDGKEYIRKDGKLYTGEELETLKMNNPEFIYVDEVKPVRFKGRTRIVNLKSRKRIENPDYWKNESARRELVAGSARVGIRGALDMLRSLPTTGLSLAEQIECHQRWYDLVSAYSGRSITYRSDKLVALSGLVDLIQANTNLEYVAGLWKTTLALDLLWISCQPVQQRSKERIAPSWSWASAEGRIKSILATRPSRRVAQVCIELLQVTDSEALPSTGGASITLNGPVRCVNLSDIPHTLDYVLHEDSESYVHLAVYWESCSDRLVLDMVWGLLLRRADDAPDGVYERCGLATICPLDRQSEWETRQLTLI